MISPRLFGDQRRLSHRTPCADCPFRKKSLRGYLGGFPVRTYAEPVEQGIPTSCHHKDFGLDDPRTALCAGSLATLSNAGSNSILVYQDTMDRVGKREDCLDSPEEFREHHSSADQFVTRCLPVDLEGGS